MSKDPRSPKTGGSPTPRRSGSGAGPQRPQSARRGHPGARTKSAPQRTGASAKGAPQRGSRHRRRAALYRRRRVFVGAVAALVLAAAIFGIAQGVSFVKDKFGSEEPESVPTTTTESSGPSEEELANPQACRSEAIDLSIAPEETTVSAGSGVKVPITITNDGDVQCLIDVGNDALQMNVTSGEDTVWTTQQCATNPQENEVLLAPGADEQDVITWSGTRSSEDCPDDAPVAEAGTYEIEVRVSADGGSVTEDGTVDVTEDG